MDDRERGTWKREIGIWLAILAVIYLALVAMMAKGFHWF